MKTCSNCAFRYRKATFIHANPNADYAVATGGGIYVCFGSGEECSPGKTCADWQPSEAELINKLATLEDQLAEAQNKAAILSHLHGVEVTPEGVQRFANLSKQLAKAEAENAALRAENAHIRKCALEMLAIDNELIADAQLARDLREIANNNANKCFSCQKCFQPNEKLSLAFTDKGNKVLCRECANKFDSQLQKEARDNE